jgi:hypothetical protein
MPSAHLVGGLCRFAGMKPQLAFALLTVTGCWSGQAPASDTSAIQGNASPVEFLERWVAFAPVSYEDPIASYAAPLAKAEALIQTIPAETREGFDAKEAKAYDIDADGTVDLVAIPQVMFGPSDGFVVYVRDGAKAKHVLSTSGTWHAAVQTPSAVALRFQANILADGEARFSQTITYDRAARAWRPLVKSYAAMQGKTPAPTRLVAFATRGEATLRATPAIDDKPMRTQGMERSTTLRGNAVAKYGAAARGFVLAEEGEWRYVAFDPATRPTATSLGHGMDHEPEQPSELEAPPPEEEKPNQLKTKTWLCGWVRAAEIR